jgi:hypothetical protein
LARRSPPPLPDANLPSFIHVCRLACGVAELPISRCYCCRRSLVQDLRPSAALHEVAVRLASRCRRRRW